MINIDRADLLHRLRDFALNGHGLLVGKPGVGKSFLLSQLHHQLVSQGIIAFLIKVDKLTEVTDEEISIQLGLRNNWIEHFKSIKAPNGIRPILMFDAFDAAREELKRNRVLEVIREGKKQLSDTWNFLVSVREYDADKSTELLNLFHARRQGSFEQAIARKFVITELSETELKEAVKDSSLLQLVVNYGNEKLNEILKVPFYLALLDSIIRSQGDNLAEITLLKSEIQLLNKFWKIKILDQIDFIDKERLVSDFVKALVRQKSLAIARNSLLELSNVKQGPLDYLRSENIVEVGSDLGTKASFSHNIFFDYLASRYALPEQLEDLEAFMKEDLSRVFFLRPSFIYLFTNLWYINIESFWRAYWRFIGSDENGIKLFARLTLNSIVANEYTDVEQLTPILADRDLATQDTLIRYILQSIRFQHTAITAPDLQLFKTLSERLSFGFLFDFGYLAHRGVTSAERFDNLDIMGEIARNYLNYTIRERKGNLKNYYDRMGATFGVDLVCKTFTSDLHLSAKCLREVIELLKEEDFEILYFSNLTENVNDIIASDPNFAAEIYLKIFGHTELSNKQTQMSPSVLMTFSSNRQQDFEMCYYRLEMHFPLMVKADPIISIKIALPIVARKIIQKKMLSYEGSISIDLEKFNYGDFEISYFPDRSAVWGENMYDLNEAKLIDTILANIEIAIETAEQFSALVLTYFKSAQSAFCWNRIIAVACKYPAEFKELILPLYGFETMVIGMDTSFEMRAFLSNVQRFLSDDELEMIEKLALKHYENGQESALKMFLSQVPLGRLTTERGRKLFENREVVENMRPFQFFSSSSDYTEEEFLKDRGINVEDGNNRDLMDKINALNLFNSRYLNGPSSASDLTNILEVIKHTFSTVYKTKESMPEQLFNSALRSVAQASVIASMSIFELESEAFKLIHAVTNFSFEYVSTADIQQANNSPMRGYSATPRIEAAEALVNLYARSGDLADWEIIKSAAADQSIIVRFKTIRRFSEVLNLETSYEQYWRLLTDRLKKENDGFVYGVLLGNIHLRESDSKEDRRLAVEELLIIIESKRNDLIKDSSFREAYTNTLLWALFGHRSQLAKEIMKHAIDNVEFCNTIIFKAFDQLHPSRQGAEFDKNTGRFQVVIEIMLHYLAEIDSELSVRGYGDLDFSVDSVKNSFSILNQIILRIYFQLSELRIGGPKSVKLPINEVNRKAFYFLIKPIYIGILTLSSKLNGTGLMTGSSAHYFIQSLNIVLGYDVRFVLQSVLEITRFAKSVNYAFDSLAIREIVSLTERLLADHRYLLQEQQSFSALLELLDIYADAGWTDALDLLWKLDEVFK